MLEIAFLYVNNIKNVNKRLFTRKEEGIMSNTANNIIMYIEKKKK